MKFFEIKKPYYSLIRAESKKDALEIYAGNVADIEWRTLESISEKSEAYAALKFAQKMKNYLTLEEILEDLEDVRKKILISEAESK
ncbi:hypothetical protein [Bacillus safensis]|uniref:hypothetical protein n=1 Tax=Bacillus safensis TaxID=561879 RepID=UPI002FFD9579